MRTSGNLVGMGSFAGSDAIATPHPQRAMASAKQAAMFQVERTTL
jgi:hypothetical protein